MPDQPDSPTANPAADASLSLDVRAATGIDGLDELLDGGLPTRELILIQGSPGTGKTTLGLQFALAGVAAGEKVLYLSMSETDREIRRIALSHGWSLEGIELQHRNSAQLFDTEQHQTMLHPAEVELPATASAVLSILEETKPQRVVIDSLSELRMLARDPAWYRRQILRLKEQLSRHGCTPLLLDDTRAESPDHNVQSLASGVIALDRELCEYGPARRHLTILKIRGQDFDDGRHDMIIQKGGLRVFPRLVAARHREPAPRELFSSGVAELDALLGGGIDSGSSVLLIGPTGTGKSTLGMQCLAAAAEREQPCAAFVFDERVPAMLARCRGLGLDLEQHIDQGLLQLEQIDAAEITPGQFGHRCRRAVEEGVRLVLIDSLNGYFYAMPNDRFLALHFNELVNYLNQHGVTVLATSAQHGLVGGNLEVPVDLSFLADTVVLLRHFEFEGTVRQAMSVHKRRGGAHERQIRELRLTGHGLELGPPLADFHGVLTGVPRFVGQHLEEN